MIRERPILRRHIKALLRQAMAGCGIPYEGLYGIPEMLLKHLPKNEPVRLVDVGAHDGDFTFGIACYCGLHTGVLVEPLPHKATALKERFRAREYHVFGCALADRAGTVDLRVNEIEATASILSIRRDLQELDGLTLGQERIVSCEQRTLDSVIAEVGLSGVDLLKLDVQGAEHLVLAGATKTLLGTRRVWTECSFKPLYAGSSTFMDLHALLTGCGFQLIELNPAFRSRSGELLQVDALFARP